MLIEQQHLTALIVYRDVHATLLHKHLLFRTITDIVWGDLPVLRASQKPVAAMRQALRKADTASCTTDLCGRQMRSDDFVDQAEHKHAA